ncbi:POTRA domain-containing protein, partial [Phenylobacterium sp.]|uniref:POTRA domain-containing protein n=1 Tax=Phenylobacterium sp. TaxID=1871053 RepID=UPI002EDA352D
MSKTRAKRAALASGLALLFGTTAVALPGVAAAQVQGGVIQRILVQGNERIEQSTVVSYLPVGPGETIDAAKADLAIKALFRTDLFSDVKIDFQNGDLIVTVVENPIINRVIFEGNSGLKEDKLRDEVTVRPRGIFTRAKVQGDVQRIVELYRRSGRISANVTPQIIELPQKRVDLIFKIDEGPKSGILSVNFLGNKAFSDNDLRDVVVTEETRWFKFFSNNA